MANGSRQRVAASRQAQKNVIVKTANANISSYDMAIPRSRNPFFYWKQNNIDVDITDDQQLKEIRAFCRLLYRGHKLIPAAIDIFTKFPIQGAILTCKDEKLKDFYEDHFFSAEGLNYREFLIDFGREFWVTGEAIALGTWNAELGVWDADTLLNPDDVRVVPTAFSKDPRFFMKIPDVISRTLNGYDTFGNEQQQLLQMYPEYSYYNNSAPTMPVSNILLKHYKFKGDTFSIRGIPILMRAFRTILQEQMIHNAQDAIAERLWVPLLLAKIGASATDLGVPEPWIPTPEQLESFTDTVNKAMAADFRMITTAFSNDITQVFGKEQMPDLSGEYSRIDDEILQVFGMSKTMLTGADAGETYAADAINRDLIVQLLTHYQQMLKDHFRERALIVAEAQGHYDYEELPDGSRKVIMEEILEVDEDGNRTIVEQPKLLVPELTFGAMNFSDGQTERDFIEQLVASGVPISDATRLKGLELDLEEEMQKKQDETEKKAIAEQQTRRAVFIALRNENLPIPQDLLTDFAPQVTQGMRPATPGRIPQLGTDPVTDNVNTVPDAQNMATMPDDTAGTGSSPVIPDPAMMGPMSPGTGTAPGAPPSRPEESDEMRAGMPTTATLWRSASQMRRIIAQYGKNSPRWTGVPDGLPRGKFADPAHVGLRRHVEIPDDQKVIKD